MVGHQRQRRGVRVLGQRGQVPYQLLTAPQVQARGRLVEQQQLGVGHQRPGDLHPLPLPFRERAVRAVGQTRHPELAQQLLGALLVQRVVLLPPPADHRPGGGHHHVPHPLVGGDPLPERGRAQPNPGTQLVEVGAPDALTQRPHLAGRGVHPPHDQVEQRRLAGAVGPQDDPPLVRRDPPRQVPQQRHAGPEHADPADVDHRVGVRRPVVAHHRVVHRRHVGHPTTPPGRHPGRRSPAAGNRAADHTRGSPVRHTPGRRRGGAVR